MALFGHRRTFAREHNIEMTMERIDDELLLNLSAAVRGKGINATVAESFIPRMVAEIIHLRRENALRGNLTPG